MFTSCLDLFLLTLLSLTTKVALTVTAPGMLEALASVATGSTLLVTGLGNVFGKTHRYKKVRKRIYYHCSTSPGGIWVIVFIFSQGRHYDKDNRINRGERQDLVKSYSGGITNKDIWG
jgi:amino acid transporter